MKLESIQYLRAVAAVMIVMLHMSLQVSRLSGAQAADMIQALHAGVDIFFVISGLVMWTSSRNAMTALSFWRNRLVRIVPLYWLMTTAVVMLAVLMPTTLQGVKFDALHTLMSYLFLPWPNPAFPDNAYDWPVLVVGWSINCEMAFYFIFGLALLVFSRQTAAGNRLPLAMAIVVCLVTLSLLHYTPLSQSPLASFYFSYRNLEFAGGILLGYCFQQYNYKLSSRNSFFIIAFGVLLLPFSVGVIGLGEVHDYIFVLASTLIVGGAVACEGIGFSRKVPLLLLIGDASYAIYLCHPMLLSAFMQIWKRIPYDASAAGIVIFVFMSLALSILVGIQIHQRIEQPLLRAFKRRPAAYDQRTKLTGAPVGIWARRGIAGKSIAMLLPSLAPISRRPRPS